MKKMRVVARKPNSKYFKLAFLLITLSSALGDLANIGPVWGGDFVIPFGQGKEIAFRWDGISGLWETPLSPSDPSQGKLILRMQSVANHGGGRQLYVTQLEADTCRVIARGTGSTDVYGTMVSIQMQYSSPSSRAEFYVIRNYQRSDILGDGDPEYGQPLAEGVSTVLTVYPMDKDLTLAAENMQIRNVGASAKALKNYILGKLSLDSELKCFRR